MQYNVFLSIEIQWNTIFIYSLSKLYSLSAHIPLLTNVANFIIHILFSSKTKFNMCIIHFKFSYFLSIFIFFFLLKHLSILIFLSIPIFSSLRVCDFKDSKNYAWKNSAQFLWMSKRLERKLYLLKWLPVSSDYGRGGYQKPSNPKQGTIGQAIVEAPHQAWLLA